MAANNGIKMAEYRQLGKCGLRVSVPILGAMSFGTKKWAPWVIEEDEALPLLKAAWDHGVTTIDTANVYSNGESEKIIAKFIETYNIPRSELIIATKCIGLVSRDPTIRTGLRPDLANLREYVNQGGLSRGAIFKQVDASLERLRTSYIDLLQIHRFDPKVPVEETMKALHDVVESGKVRYIGASSMRCWQFALMNEVAEKNGWTKFVSMQDEYSLLYREDEREMHAYCNYNGIGIIPWAPLAAGALARPFGTQTTRSSLSVAQYKDSDKLIISRVDELAKKKGCTMGQIALAWTQTKVASPIVGCSSAERLEEAIVQGVELTKEEIVYLEEPYEPKPIRGHA
ncbi:hypothetical protein JAAARDRAFT_61084 [Jaapia argillacea MUCL 33604]|uniref:NADP-dependent oxidoreductase domain-containing protein n=1 Tax=Jaapia argillacea MUCL 33604 TaxID=933084 RepID=A0A067PQT8_9AGAM|nr:hypothetical protein JAAARDRAFT_61084 [Jaapia argillacea MUCL 33604]